MKNNFNIPEQAWKSIWNEKLHTIIERDVMFIALIMILGLIRTDTWGMRGFPFAWIRVAENSFHPIIRPGNLILDIVIVVITVASGEIISAVIRKATEPDAFRSMAKTVSYANTFDDTESTGVKNNNAATQNRKAASAAPSPFRLNSPTVSSIPARPVGTAGLRTLVAVIIITAILCILVAAVMLVSTNRYYMPYEDDGPDILVDTDGQEDVSDPDFYNSPFFEEDEYLYPMCEEAMDKIKEGDAEWLSSIGEGDAEGILDCTDWSDAELSWDYKTASTLSPDYGGFIRFIAETDTGEFMIGFKFTGEDMVWEEDNAVLSGIAVCPYSEWDDYDNSEPNSWTELSKRVDKKTVYVGDYKFIGHNILTW